MSTWNHMLLAGAATLAPAAALAAPTEAPLAEVVAAPAEEEEATPFDSEAAAAEARAKMQKELDEVIALVEKMFDTKSLPPIDPARLAIAEQTTAALIPAGSIEKMLDNLYGRMFRTLMREFSGQSTLMLSIKTGVESDKIAALDDATKGQIADLFDPHRKEREEQITRVVMPLIREALADMEPPMRAGLAKAYARRFTGAQLADVNAFLATPTGRLYASEWMALQADPEVMVAVIKAVPPLITKFMDRAPEIEKDFKELPKEKQLADLGDEELARLAGLMKVDVSVLREQRDMGNADTMDATDTADPDDHAVDAAADAAEAAATAADAAEAAATAVENSEYDRSNWSEADRQRVEQLEAAYLEAEAAAIEKARERLGRNPSD
ncbi:DUF2059 domain-containing protein [Sphingopyxis sp. LK2115]|uniref:DUF2059 domain-containing protein n=1 Tax=Sphingopyxis sp. LK2115 TaxID=2744558 RepID=UPI001CB6BB3D|nr:DUF2059 domain-containing protein [Sphingopyxis sp. LK2115]